MPSEIIGEGWLAPAGLAVNEFIYSHSRLYFAILEPSGLLSVYAGEGPDDASKYKVWDTATKVGNGYKVTKLFIGFYHNENTKAMQIVIEPLKPGKTDVLWASSASTQGGVMECLLLDDGNLYLRQNINSLIWDNGFHDPLLESVVPDINYDTKNIRRTLKGNPYRVEIGSAENKTKSPQTFPMTVKHTVTTTHTWSDKVGTTFGMKATTAVNVPFIGSTSVEVSASVTNEFTFGKSYTDSREMDFTLQLNVDPGKKYKAWAEVQEMDYELPFTTTGTFRFKSGKQVTRTVSGTYHGVSGDRGQVGWDDITDPKSPKNVFTATGAEAGRILAASRI